MMTDKISELIDKIKAAQSLTERRALRAELRRARRPRLRRARREGPISSEIGPEDPDAEAIKTWPPALRARLGRSPYSRVIDGRPVDDAGAHGQRNDLRRWSPWR